MFPNTDRRQISFPKLKYPPFRDEIVKLPDRWLKGKRMHDGAEGLWRINDNLYDLTEFIRKHPGGPQWLFVTKGTDITESFETHHLKGRAETYLPKYFIRKAVTARNYPFTFHEDGFYKTLKAKVVARLNEIPHNCRDISNAITIFLLISLIMTSPICCWLYTKSTMSGIISTLIVSYILSMLTVCTHNYLHRADNWQMYLYNISGLSYREWRVSHAMSHHLYTNTAHDLELSMLEPFLQYLPSQDKTVWAQMAAIYYPVIFALTSLGLLIKEWVASLNKLEGKHLTWEILIPFMLPTWMWLASGICFFQVIPIWLAMILSSSLIFMTFGLTSGHHGHTNFFEGDILSNENIDWGIYQMLTVVDNIDNSIGHFRTLTRFGSHSLHHLFPTLDHGELLHLYPLVMEHCKEYETELRRTSFFNALISQSKQLARKQPNEFGTYINKKI